VEIPTEALAAAGGAITAVVGALWWQVRDRIRTLERSLAKALELIEELREHDQAERTQLLLEAHDRERRLAAVIARWGEPRIVDQSRVKTESIARDQR
jgi:shikimate 5-dehydrogenase